jgi:hypothetical protein
VPLLAADRRLLGVAAAGSYASGEMDAFSDLDLVIGVEPDSVAAIVGARHALATALGPLLAAFTGEHVGEPRLLICLYAGDGGSPPLHVDLKFVALDDLGPRVDEPVVLWERDARFSRALLAGEARYPMPDPQWIEDRFWVWVHYGASKIGRGELFEALDFLGFLRGQVLGPLTLLEVGAPPAGVRRLEASAPSRARALATTVASHDAESCLRSLSAAVDLYRSLRAGIPPALITMNHSAEREALTYVRTVAAALGVTLSSGGLGAPRLSSYSPKGF